MSFSKMWSSHHLSDLLCTKYSESFKKNWPIPPDAAAGPGQFLYKNLEILKQVKEEETEKWRKYLKESSTCSEGVGGGSVIVGSLLEFGRVALLEGVTPSSVTRITEEFSTWMNQMVDIVTCIDKAISFLKLAIDVDGFIELIPGIGQICQGVEELLVAVGGWAGELVENLHGLGVGEEHVRVVNRLMTLGGRILEDVNTIWQSDFIKLWGFWMDVQMTVVEICHRAVICAIGGTGLEVILNESVLEGVGSLMEKKSGLEDSLDEFSKTMVQNVPETVSIKFSRMYRMSKIVKDMTEKQAELVDVVNEINSLFAVASEQEDDHVKWLTLQEKVSQLGTSIKNNVDICLTSVDVMMACKQNQEGKSFSKVSGKHIPKEEADVESEVEVEKGAENEPGTFTDVSKIAEDSEEEDDDFDKLIESDQFFVSRGKLGELESQNVTVPDYEMDLAQTSFRNVVSELKTKLSDVKENMDIREKNAAKKAYGDNYESDSNSDDDSENQPRELCVFNKQSLGIHKNEDSAPDSFKSQLWMAMAELQVKDAEEFEG